MSSKDNTPFPHLNFSGAYFSALKNNSTGHYTFHHKASNNYDNNPNPKYSDNYYLLKVNFDSTFVANNIESHIQLDTSHNYNRTNYPGRNKDPTTYV